MWRAAPAHVSIAAKPQGRNRYEGEFHQGLRQGSGTFYYADGSRYCGQWHNNLKHGYGVHTHADGAVSEGTFKQDRLVRSSS